MNGFKCKRPGHISVDCLLLNEGKFEKKKNVTCATCCDLHTSERKMILMKMNNHGLRFMALPNKVIKEILTMMVLVILR